ncbi:MAG: hypothetical protein PWR24_1396 [Desulfonauticus sp.]|jgi:Tfp pilus assembly protein PilO|nr:hypothetical protein [Desulfonauticus sp.]
MELFLFLILLLFIAIVDSLLIAYINSKFNKNFALLHKEKEEIENNYKLLRQEILNLQQQLKEQETLLQEKKLAHEKQLQQQEEIEKNITDPVTYIRQKKLVPETEIKRAEEYVRKTATNLSILDALLLLGILDEEKLAFIKKHIGREE